MSPPPPVAGRSQGLSAAAWEDQGRGSYRVQDLVEVHEADGHGDGLQEDGGEHAEPQAGQRHGHGHATAWTRPGHGPDTAPGHPSSEQQPNTWSAQDKSDQAPQPLGWEFGRLRGRLRGREGGREERREEVERER